MPQWLLQLIALVMCFLEQTSLLWNPAAWWSPVLWQQAQSFLDRFFIQMSEDLPDRHWVFDAGDDAHITTAFTAGVWDCAASGVLAFLPFPCLAGVTRTRYLLLGALCQPPDYADLTSRTHIANDDGRHEVGIKIAIARRAANHCSPLAGRCRMNPLRQALVDYLSLRRDHGLISSSPKIDW